MSADPQCTPTLLLILDGYGVAPEGPGNAARLAHTPHLDRLLALPGRTNIAASGRDVGLPAGYMGNSEVGHLNLGAGRIVYQDMTRIDIAVENGELARNPVLTGLLEAIRARNGRLHLMGLLSDGGVHSHIHHLDALLAIARAQNVPVIVHAFMDGRDTPPTSGAGYLARLGEMFARHGGRLGSFVGRFYAMDRDKRWDRVKSAWDLLTLGRGERCGDPLAAVEAAYAAGETDEFLKPRLCGEPTEVCVRDGDGVLMFNFRADRARELTAAFHQPDFAGFDREVRPDLAGLASMTSYDAAFSLPVLFAKDNLEATLGEVVAKSGKTQLRIAETEKYAHVTYFFSGGREAPFPGEARIMVNSPKDVSTYDLKPQMSAVEVTDKLLAAWAEGGFSLCVCNLANPDMVGHTGKMEAALQAMAVVDQCVGRIEAAVAATGGRLLLTADHGNVECMLDAEGHPHTAHTCNPVPALLLEAGRPVPLRQGGRLADIAPTLLQRWGLPQPTAMTGQSLVE